MTNFSAKAPIFGLSLLAMTIISGGLISLNPNQANAQNQKPKTLVELFTSQGCNSCPRANALLKKYVDREDVIAISLPVDYWDYLGWTDTFGKSQFSTRQRRYASRRGDGQVYTPQIVANGVTHAVGSRQNAIDRAIRKSYGTVSRHQIPLNVKLEDNRLTVSTTTPDLTPRERADTPPPTATVWLALTKKKVATKVPRGENRGTTITYYNVVRELKAVGKWNGKSLTIRLPKDHSMDRKSDGCIVFLQTGKAGPIIGAAEL